MSYLEEVMPEFRKGAKIRCSNWDKESYIKKENGLIVNEKGYIYDLSNSEILSQKWELYQEPIDWDYIIKNKCLCWFWDIIEEAKIVGILCKINYDSEHKFVRDFDGAKIAYRNCLPVRRDEVAFYEDRKDE